MIAIYCDQNLDLFNHEIHYVFDFIFKTLGYDYKFISTIDELSDNDILFFYGFIQPTRDEAYLLAFNKIFFYIPVQPELLKPGYWKQKEIQAYKKSIKLSKPVVIISKKDFDFPVGYLCEKELIYGTFHFDIAGNIFYHLSRYELDDCKKRDEWHRVPDDAFLFSNEFHYPFINELLNLIDSFIVTAVQDKPGSFVARKENWPKGEHFAVCCTHQVDKLRKWTYGKVFKGFLEDIAVFYKIGYVFKSFCNKMKYVLTNVEEYWNFPLIEELESKFRIKSTYFWGANDPDEEDIDYDVYAEDIQEEIKKIQRNDHEIALLASYKSTTSDIVKKEKEALQSVTDKKAQGIRQSRFRFDFRKTSEFHRKHQFDYDSTLRLLDSNGFLNGIAIPFYIYQPQNGSKQNDKSISIKNLEIPLHFSDDTLILSKFKNLSFDKAKESVHEILRNAEKVRGLCVLDFSVANFGDISYLKDLYQYLLKSIRTHTVYNATLRDMATWWRKREQVVIRESGNNLYVHFPVAVDFFTVSLQGKVEIEDIQGVKPVVEKNKLIFSSLKPDSTAKIKIRITE